MSTRRDRAEERRALKNAEKDLTAAKTAAKKAFDLKDPRLLGEAALAASRGPAGLALFGASRGLKLVRERRAEQAEVLDGLAADAKLHAETLREHASVVAGPAQKRRSPFRRFAPLWIVGLAGGAAVAGATAYFLRDEKTPASAPSVNLADRPDAAPTGGGTDPAAGGPAVVDTPDPEGPADQGTDTTTPASSASEPSDEELSRASDEGLGPDPK